MNVQQDITECASRELQAVFDHIGNPPVLTIEMLCHACEELKSFPFFIAHSNAQSVKLLGIMGYRRVDNPHTASGEWRIGKRKKIVYARSDIEEGLAYPAIKDLVRRGWTA